MSVALAVIVIAALGGLAAGWVLWRAAHLGGLWNLAAGVLLGLFVFIAAILFAYLMAKYRDLV